jgi:hypothetical protein
MTQASRLMRSSPEFHSGFGVLINLFGLASVEIPTGIVQRFAEAAQMDTNRMAILANPMQMGVYGLARLYEILGDRKFPGEMRDKNAVAELNSFSRRSAAENERQDHIYS